MKLAGLHHVTMITGDAQENVRFYADLLGLRFVKKTVNFDAPEAYHLYFGDEQGTPGSILTWFEFPGAARGRAGAGMIHTLQLGVASEASLDFWEERLGRGTRGEGSLRFEDYDGLGLELVVADAANPPLRATHPEIPAEHAILGIEGARAYSEYAGVEERMLTDVLGFAYEDGGEYRPERLRARLPLGLRPRARDAQRAGRRHRPPHRLGHARRRAARLAAAHPRGRRLRDRPSRTATTSSRSTSASRAACCSRSRP